MDLIQIVVLAIGLSMDSLIIALTSGAILGNHQPINVLKIAGLLALMQMSLTVFGWSVGTTFVEYIGRYDHWIAFSIFFFLGARVLFSCLKGEEECSPFNPLCFKVMLGLAIATSLDATAVGLSMSLVDSNILFPAIIIGFVTFVIASMGIVFGSKIGEKYNLGINLTGGVILIFIGCSILIEHTISDTDIFALL